MSRSTVSLLAVAVLALAGLFGVRAVAMQPSAEAASYTVDPVHSCGLFRVKHLGAGHFYGRFNEPSGKIRYATGSADGLMFDITIPIESVDSGNEKLDAHLKSPDFFSAKEFPNMTFKSTSAKKVGDGKYEITGDLSMHGVTKPITVTMTKTGQKDLGRGERVGFEGEFMVNRTDFGMEYGVSNGALGDETKVIIALEATRD